MCIVVSCYARDAFECSPLRSLLFLVQTRIMDQTQEEKDRALFKAMWNFDYCATQHWLQQGAQVEQAFAPIATETERGKVLRIPVWGGLKLLSWKGEPATKEQFLDLLKPHGIIDIHYYK